MTRRRTQADTRQLELADLRGRLDEAEQTLQAIRSGEVDALVVSGVDGERIFTLQGADHSYRVLIESMQQGALILDSLGLVLYANRCFAEMLRAPLEQVMGSDLFHWVTPESQSLLVALLQQGHQLKHDCELVLTASDGVRVPSVFSIGQHDLGDNTDHLCLVATDLTEVYARKHQEADILRQQLVTADQFQHQLEAVIQSQKLAEKAATTSAHYARSLFDVSLDPLVTISRQGQIMDSNMAMEQVTGVAREQLIGSNFQSYFTDPEKSRNCYQQAFAQGFTRACPLSIRHLSGRVTEVLYNASVYRDGDNVVMGVFASARDITERKRMEDQIRKLAFHDTLTHLPNRRLLLDRLGQAMSNSKRSGHCAAVIFLDLDNFKALNDSHGHSMGDLLLLEVAKRLKACVRAIDTVSRFGGDEFVLLLSDLSRDPGESLAEARRVAEKIRLSVAEPYELTINQGSSSTSTVRHHCTASIGVVVFSDNESSQENILRWADAAMYRAKDTGRNRVCFHAQPQPD